MSHFINGEFFTEADAKISINDLAILRGFGIFDYFRTYDRKPFLLNFYLQRFINSAALAGLTMPLSGTEISEVINKLISLSSFEECGIRMILTGGYSIDAFTPVKPNFLILTEKFQAPQEKNYTQGVRIISYEYQRDIPEAKLLNYSSSIIFNSRNIDKKATEILYYFHGKISEASRSNFFVIKDNRLITAGANILKGITRKSVLSLAHNEFDIHEENFPIDQLSSVEEAFITSTTKGIMPVVKVDDQIIGDGGVGKKTVRLMMQYKSFIGKHREASL